jgi:hypothetical protein
MEHSAYELSAHAAERIRRRGIDEAWITEALAAPDRVEPDRLDPAVRHALKKIAACEGRVLRVVYNPTVSPPRIVSVHFDRRLKGRL